MIDNRVAMDRHSRYKPQPRVRDIYRPPSQVGGACSGIVVGMKLRGYELTMQSAAAALRPGYRDLDYPTLSHPVTRA